jgi:hypothetical protein
VHTLTLFKFALLWWWGRGRRGRWRWWRWRWTNGWFGVHWLLRIIGAITKQNAEASDLAII